MFEFKSSSHSPSSKQQNYLPENEFIKPIVRKGVDYMTMEYCPNGDLFSVIKKHGPINPAVSRYIFKQLLSAVDYLHTSLQVSHMDLKLENILLDSAFNVKLCDFGFSEENNRLLRENKGTDGYKAPEIYKKYYQEDEGGY